jgi:ADP-heptose:LPS heptosyltransferase
LARFAGLARRLVVEERNQLLLIEGPAEPGLAAQVAQSLPDGEAIRAESLPLALLAAVMAQCCGFVGNDSGIAHLAAALRIPSIVLFGPTLPRHWSPLGESVTVLRDPDGCAACNDAGEDCHTCLENIEVERVLRELRAGRQILGPETDKNERIYNR